MTLNPHYDITVQIQNAEQRVLMLKEKFKQKEAVQTAALQVWYQMWVEEKDVMVRFCKENYS